MNTADPYLILRHQHHIPEIPKKYVQYLETVRQFSAWKEAGFSIALDKDGHPTRGRSKWFYFTRVKLDDPIITEAIKNDTKAITDANTVCYYLAVGCKFEDFVHLRDDVMAYAEGNILRTLGKLEEALPLLERACSLNPQEVQYRSVYYETRLKLGDISSIAEEFRYFQRDIDTIIHCGRFNEWIKVLILARDFVSIRDLLANTEVAISRLVNGKTTTKYYTSQDHGWYEAKRNEFRKKAESTKRRIGSSTGDSTNHHLLDFNIDNIEEGSDGEDFSTGSVASAKVQEVLFNFNRNCLITERTDAQPDLFLQDAIFSRLACGSIRFQEIHHMPDGQRRLLYELLNQYITFLQMNERLTYPRGFLEGSSAERLSNPLLAYIVEHRWPFPQMLKLQH